MGKTSKIFFKFMINLCMWMLVIGGIFLRGKYNDSNWTLLPYAGAAVLLAIGWNMENAVYRFISKKAGEYDDKTIKERAKPISIRKVRKDEINS